jgi:hypothetical protein
VSDDGSNNDPDPAAPPPRAAPELRGPQGAHAPPPLTLRLCPMCGLTYPADSRCPRGH